MAPCRSYTVGRANGFHTIRGADARMPLIGLDLEVAAIPSHPAVQHLEGRDAAVSNPKRLRPSAYPIHMVCEVLLLLLRNQVYLGVHCSLQH